MQYRREVSSSVSTSAVSTESETKGTKRGNDQDSSNNNQGSSASSSSCDSTSRPKMNREQRKDYNKVDKDISKLTAAIKELNEKINDPANASLGYSALADWSKEAQQLQEKLEDRELLWMEYHERFDIDW